MGSNRESWRHFSLTTSAAAATKRAEVGGRWESVDEMDVGRMGKRGSEQNMSQLNMYGASACTEVLYCTVQRSAVM